MGAEEFTADFSDGTDGGEHSVAPQVWELTEQFPPRILIPCFPFLPWLNQFFFRPDVVIRLRLRSVAFFCVLTGRHELHDLHERSADVLHVRMETTFLFPKPADALALLWRESGHSLVDVGLVR